ncbi:hypothetical protein ACFWUW_19810 [Streptomyces sp. NPDC058655]|uniref:hypothetical protein n=1 Tax=Streptomyces sp. NPDC058655 TaxID=3346577 RepID=UPI003656171F
MRTTAAPPPRAARGARSKARAEARHPARARPSRERAPGAGGLLERVGRCLDAVADVGRGVRGGDGQEVAEGGDVAGAFALPGAAQQGGRFADPVLCERPVRRGDKGLEAFADAGQGQVVGERRAGEPDRARAVVGAVPRQRDRVPEQRAGLVAAFAHAHARVAKPVEEVGVAVRERGRGTDGALQGLPGSLHQAAAGGLLGLASDRAAARGPVERRHRGQAPAGP